MKKLISVLLSLILIIGSVSVVNNSYAVDESSNEDLYNFAEDLVSLIRDYNDKELDEKDLEDYVVYAEQFLGGQETDQLMMNFFETKRLIVKSPRDIEKFGAVECVSGYNDLYILQYDSTVATKEAYEHYLKLDYIEYVEPDIILSAADGDLPGDDIEEDDISGFDDITAEAMEWLQDKIGFSDIKDELLSKIQDDYVLVAVLDSGVDTDHEQLADRLEDSDINLSSSGNKNSCEDDYGHGTHVTGIIANNTLSNVKIKPYKVLNSEGKCSLSVIALAVDMAVADGADIINMSLTAQGESERMTEAVDNAVANNVNVVVAAGNNSADLDRKKYTPACIESAITVSATDSDDKLASFSNYDGPIDIAAPGVNIKSCYLNNSYVTMSGTSMAAPQVTAGLAIIQSIIKDLSASKTEQRIKEYAIPLFENEGENPFGAGLLYLKYLLDNKPTTATPVFSVESCNFSENFNLTITCPEEADIYYIVANLGTGKSTFDWISASKYTEPVPIRIDTKIYAIAVAKGKYPSDIATAEYNRMVDNEEDNYEINTLGYITAYYGDETNLIIPNTLKGKTVKGIASSAFKNDNRIRSIVLPDTATKINASAFDGCTALVSISGNGITEIGVDGFAKSSICSFEFPNLTKIGIRAFTECYNLTTISMDKVETIGAYAFNKTPKLTELNLENIVTIGSYAFEESGVQSVNLANVTTIGMNAFTSCEDLFSVSTPQLIEIGINAFRNCTSLKNLDMPLLTTISANAFRNSGIETFFGRYVKTIGNYAFAENASLASVFLPSLESSGTNAFAYCTELQIAMLPTITELNNNSFYGCTKLKMLYLPAVKTVGSLAFYDSGIEYLRFNCVEEIKSLPQTLKGMVLPSTLTSISATTPETDFVVYGYENTYAQEYAVENNKEFQTVPAILYETTGQVNPDDKFIVVYAMGFSCTYQWYKNDEVSNENGTLIEGEDKFYYEPSVDDEAVAYYCVITSSDGVSTNSAVTHPILNCPEYRPADLTEYNKVVEKVDLINRQNTDEFLLEDLDNLLSINVSNLTYDNQDVVDSIVERIGYVLFEIENGFLLGDINHDNKLSAYDARVILCFASETLTPSKQQQRTADMNGDGEITAIDARMLLTQCFEA
ncbi:MAG: leucine-rich repeat protein [Clostridia bacterium]|nr:leucine-rich repeat protein [Clostridia bacterium]